VIYVQVGHQHERELAGIDAALAQPRRDRPLWARTEGGKDEGVEAAEVGLQPIGGGGMEAGVDENPTGGRVLEQEGADRASQPFALGDADAERAACRPTSLLAVEPAGRRERLAAQDRVQAHSRLR
jgi:hypothetical protein